MRTLDEERRQRPQWCTRCWRLLAPNEKLDEIYPFRAEVRTNAGTLMHVCAALMPAAEAAEPSIPGSDRAYNEQSATVRPLRRFLRPNALCVSGSPPRAGQLMRRRCQDSTATPTARMPFECVYNLAMKILVCRVWLGVAFTSACLLLIGSNGHSAVCNSCGYYETV